MKEDFTQDKELIEKERFDAISQVAATVNHEINTPLMVVLLNLELLLSEKNGFDKKTIERLKTIQKESSKIKDVTKKLADITVSPSVIRYQGNIKMLDIKKNSRPSKNVLAKFLSFMNSQKVSEGLKRYEE